MSTTQQRQLTDDELALAQEMGMSPEAYAEATAPQERPKLPKGTYKFRIAGGSVKAVTFDGDMKDALQANLTLKPLDTEGNIAKRFTAFKRITVPTPNGKFQPNENDSKYGAQNISWLATAAGVKVSDVFGSFKQSLIPTELLDAEVTARVVYVVKNGIERMEVYPVTEAKPKLDSVKPDAAKKSA